MRTEFEFASARPSTPIGGTLKIPDSDAIRRVATTAMRARCRQHLSAGRCRSTDISVTRHSLLHNQCTVTEIHARRAKLRGLQRNAVVFLANHDDSNRAPAAED